MNLENHTALDTSVMELVQPQTDESTSTGVELEGENTPEVTTEETQEVTTPAIQEFEIDGIGKLTVDEIKELKQSGLRQQDYTKKTQELARQRQENAEALELYEYLRSNPQLITTLQAIEGGVVNPVMNTATPESALLREVYYNQKSMEVDMKLNSLKQKYGEVDEVALFNKATELHTDDLEFVYKALKYDGATVDRQAIIEEAKAQIMAEIQANKGKTATVVSTNPSTNNFNKTVASLTPEERRVAEGMNMSPSEYLKWK